MGDYMIQISTELIEQLARDDEKVQRKARKPKPKKKPPVQQRHEEPQEGAAKENFPSDPKTSGPAPWLPLQPPPMYLPVTTPAPPPPPAATMQEVEAIRSILKESEAVLDKLDKQEAGARQELSRRAKELHDKEFKLPYQNPMPCTHERIACLECYKSNAKEPLKCAEAVKRFEACALMAMKSGTAKTD